MAEQITIAGHVFNAPIRYAEGHALTANEAEALNQTYHENLRNNFSKVVKKAAANGGPVDMETMQTTFDEYAAAYVFGERTGGGATRTRDPVMLEALKIARQRLKDKLLSEGRKPSEYTAEALTAAAKALVDKYPDITESAKQRVAESKTAAAVDLEGIIDLQPKAAE